ncbi:secondary thiamine-phosphate synthase enzyme YjbQ [Desulfobacterales bacterium HSG2]|nr:secondary thiamine-phosphate synthase enzyme YjbQ [Desulfobacterales bacterium HSG2]
MKALSIHFGKVEVEMNTGVDIKDITNYLKASIRESNIMDGNLSAAVVGSTGSVTTIEYEPGVVEDLKKAINRIAPPDQEYEHEKAWHDGNGHSHVQAALIGSSVSVPVRKGELVLGTWQQVVVINHDNRSRKRTVQITIIGTQ